MNTMNAIMGLAFTLLVVPACTRSQAEKAQPVATSLASASPVPSGTLRLSSQQLQRAKVSVESTTQAKVAQRLDFQGDVQAIPERLAAIVARLEGLVTSVAKREGDKVKKGEAMVTIKSKKLGEAKLDYLEAEHRLEFATDALEREKQLIEKRISSKEEYQRVAHEREAAELNHAAALQRLRLLGFSEAGLHQLEENPTQTMTDYTLRAPFAGEVIAKDVTLGDAVPEDKTLFRLADLSELQVQFKVPIETVPLVTKGDKAHVVCDRVGLEADGVVSHVASIADTETRSVTVRATLPNPDGQWRPGMPVHIELEQEARQARVVVPLEAVHDIDGQATVFVFVAPGTFRAQPVTLGQKGEGVQEVLEGVEAGAKVATKNSLVIKSEWLESREK